MTHQHRRRRSEPKKAANLRLLKTEVDRLDDISERYGLNSRAAVVSAFMRLCDDPIAELIRRDAPTTEHVDAPVQEAEHAVA
jgi:hypothetical protein